MKNIKIFVSHRIDFDSQTIDNPLFVPVKCGAVYDDKSFDITGDNTGDNISDKRKTFCELTVQYWAWKNIDCDYYGLCHYRRFLSFSDKEDNEVDGFGHASAECIDSEFIEKFKLNEKSMRHEIEKYDILAVKDCDLRKTLGRNITVYKSMISNDSVFKKEGIDLFIKIFKEKYPEYEIDIDDFFNGYKWKGFNCYILKKEYFDDYNKKLFDVLFELERQLDMSTYNQEQKRLIGYMGEAMFAIYYNHILRKKIAKTKQMQLVKVNYPQRKIEIQPAFKNNNIAVVMASSNEYVPFLLTLLQSIIDNMSEENNYDFIIISNGIKDDRKNKINELMNKHKNISIRYVIAQHYLSNKKFYIRDHITPITYARLAVPDILSSYKKAIYLDCDIVVNDDLANLFNLDISNYMIAAARDSVMCGWCNSEDQEEQINYNKKTLKISNNFDYFNAGVILMNLEKFRTRYSVDDLFKMATSKDWRWFDQDVLNIICENEVLFLTFDWNFMAHLWEQPHQLPEYYAPANLYEEYLKARKAPKIIHYAGRYIPCFVTNVDLAEDFWKYAAKTEYYYNILDIMMENKIGHHKNIEKLNTGIINTILPIGSMRRAMIRKVWRSIRYKK